MLATFPAPMNINILNKIPSNANIYVGNFYRDIVEENMGKDGIYCRLYRTYIHQVPKLYISTKYANINVVGITWKLFHVKGCCPCGKLTLNVGY